MNLDGLSVPVVFWVITLALACNGYHAASAVLSIAALIATICWFFTSANGE